MASFSFKIYIGIVIFSLILVGCGRQTIVPITSTSTQQIDIITPLQHTVTSIPIVPINSPEPTIMPTQTENLQILDMSFTDALHGWLLAATYHNDGSAGIAIRQTVDGGTTWTLVPAAAAQPAAWMDLTDTNPNLVRRIRFVDEQTGWVYGPGLFFTSNGGKDWKELGLGGATVALEPAGPNELAWAVVQNCPQIAHCSMQLYTTALDKPDQWTLISSVPTQHALLAFDRPDPETGYILSSDASDNFQVGLIDTHDAGKTWTTSTTACISEQPLLAAADVSHLFLVCSGLPGAGEQGKQFYASIDGGKSWRLIQNSNHDKTIPIFGYAEALVFLTSKVGVVGLGRSSLVYTQDGGISWISTEIPNNLDASGWVLAEAGGQDIFAAIQATIYHSLDGGVSWASSEIH